MNKLCLNLDKSLRYVVACSFGPDSMALLDAAIKEGLNIVVAHVNYHKRDVSNFEQEELTKFCNEHKISIHVLDLLNEESNGNFQNWARKVRYEFFKEVVEKEKASAVLVAHNEDDAIETYLMQKKRRNFVKKYGISRENLIFDVKVIRPLLQFSKQFLKDYDDKNGVPYSIDESNLKDDYLRNRIRHSIVQKMSAVERKKIIDEINNQQEKTEIIKTHFSKEEFLALDYEDIVLIIDTIMQKVDEHRNISKKFVFEILKSFKTKSTHRINITSSVTLELDYNEVFIVNSRKLKKYNYQFEKRFKNEWIDIDFSSGAEDRGIEEINSPIILQNCSKNDKIIINDYECEIRRLFIDWKMPLFLRDIWPGIYSENGKLLYVPRYRKNFEDNHVSKFKINTKYFLEF